MGQSLDREAVLAAVQSAGVVGAGGAGFPTHVKLAAKADTIIANGVECEPLLEVDQNLLGHYLDDVLAGIEAARMAVGAQQAYLAVKAKHAKLMAKLQAAAALPSWLEVIGLPDVYPMGDEQVLVHGVLGRVVPPRGIPLQVGAVVLNIETLCNIAGALKGQPVISSYLTVAGAVATPSTMAVPVGTSVGEVITWASPLLGPGEFAVIEGGPMMGHLIEDLSEPVTKTTKGLIVLPLDHGVVVRLRAQATAVRRSFSVCSQCTMCTDLCPRHLLGHPLWPHRIMRALAGVGVGAVAGVGGGAGLGPAARLRAGGQERRAEMLQGALLCSECGVCDQYACFMGLSPRQVNQELKRQFASLAADNGSQSSVGASEEHFPRSIGVSRDFQDSQVPTSRLLYRLDLARWVKPAPLRDPFPAPLTVSIPLKQHVGAEACALVQVGDVVARGDLIGDVLEGQLGAPVHSSISGVVQSIHDGVIVIRRGGSHG